MLHLYKAQFYFPFSLKQGTFNALKDSNNPTSRKDFVGEWFFRTPEISPHNPETFAEYQYFHPHTRELLFGTGMSDRPCLMAFEVYEEKIKNWKIEISWRRSQKEKTRFVNLDWVMGYFYDLDVGALIFGVSYVRDDATSPNQLSLDDALDINNLLRRSGPSFIGYDQVYDHVSGHPVKDWSEAQKGANELPLSIKIVKADGNSASTEMFGRHFDEFITQKPDSDKEDDLQSNSYIGEHYTFWIEKLFADLVGAGESKDLKKSLRVENLNPILDERNFVCSLAIVDDADTGFGEREFRPCRFGETRNPLGELTTQSEKFRKRLYQYIFIDPSTTEYTSNPEFRDHCLEQSLYLRFRDWGSYYGFTRYSGTYLLHGNGYANCTLIPEHFNSMYFQMANLLIGQRAILLNLSHRAARLAQQATSPGKLENKKLHRELEDLRSDFLKFHNKYWFSEVTGQEQGIEMFDLWSRNLGNKRLFDEVEKEIKALHDFSNATVGRRLGSIAYLNIAMLGLAGPALIASIFGMNLKEIMGEGSEGELLLTIGLYSIPIFSALTLFLIWTGSDIIDCISGIVSCHDKCKTEKGLLPKN